MEIKRDERGWIVGRYYNHEAFAYRDKLYARGTTVMLNAGYGYGKQKATFIGNGTFQLDNGTKLDMGYDSNFTNFETFEIIDPIYYDIEAHTTPKKKKIPPAVVTAIVLYIIAMVVGSIFQDRIYIYIAATIVLLCYLGGDKLNKWKKK